MSEKTLTAPVQYLVRRIVDTAVGGLRRLSWPVALTELHNHVATSRLASHLTRVIHLVNGPLHWAQLLMAYQRSEYANLDFLVFVQEVNKCVQGQDSQIDFDEKFFLQANEDVAKAVQIGTLHSGYVCYCIFPKSKQRLYSTTSLSRKFGIAPKFPLDRLTQPTHCEPSAKYGPDLSALPPASQPQLVIIVSYLRRELFFAGYSSFFDELAMVFDLFSDITLLVMMDGMDPSLALQYCDRIKVLPLQQAGQIRTMPDLIFCYDCETFFIAKDVFNNLARTIYYCQDFESGFYPYGSKYVRAESAIAHSKNLVISTFLLKEFLENRGLLSDSNVFVTNPKIEVYESAAEKSRKIFLYFRPEHFNTRNLPELIMEAVIEFSRNHKNYELYLVGSVATSYSFELNDNQVFVISKCPREFYKNLLTTCDVAVALIYSAHPGVIAFQAAASGIPTVTNVFDNRSVSLLRQISANLVPYDPVRDSLCACIERALAMEKGRPSFNRAAYAGEKTGTFPEFVRTALSA